MYCLFLPHPTLIIYKNYFNKIFYFIFLLFMMPKNHMYGLRTQTKDINHQQGLR